MRIGVFNPYLDSLGGGERYTLTVARVLSQKHDVYIFWDNEKIKEKIKERLNINLDRVKFTKNIFTRKINLLKRLILSSGYDLIFFLSDGSIPASFAKRNILHFQCPFPFVKGKNLINKIKLSRYQAVICNSQFTKKFIDEEYDVNSCVIYPPVEVNQFRPGNKKDLIISVGRFSKYYINKKQKEMVTFFKKIQNLLKEWELYLIGGVLEQDLDYFNKTKQLAKGLSVGLFPNESFKNLKRYYGKAKIYWHAAGFGENEETNPAAMEHFGISTVEAMAAGCVPIVYDGGGQREIVDHGVNGFLWKTEEELTNYTLKVAQNRDLREKLAKKAIEKSRKFDQERFEKEINQLVLRLQY